MRWRECRLGAIFSSKLSALESPHGTNAEELGGGWLVVAGHVGDGGKGFVQVRTSDTFDGSFRVQLKLPDDFRAGDALAGVSNWDYSRCPDNASCAAPMGNFTLEQ